MYTGYDSDGNWTGQLDEANGAKLGMGKGTIVDARGDEPPAIRLTRWVTRARAGDRLLLKGDRHKEIKKAQKLVAKLAREHGLTLSWRFCREITTGKRFINPEWVDWRVTEYQAWAVVRGRELRIEDKQRALTESVLRWLNRDEEQLTPDDGLPPWVFEMGRDGNGVSP